MANKKKPIGKLYENLVAYYDDGGNPHYGYEEEATVSRLDEAKNELGNYISMLNEIDETQQIVCISAKFLVDLRDGFKKWFGDHK